MKHRQHHQRGAVYIAVLGASMLVTVLGMSAIWAVQMQRKIGDLDQAASRASGLAQSALEWAILELRNNPNWRKTYTHDQWQADVSFDSGTYSFKIIDPIDSNLSDSDDDVVQVIGRGVVGQATRLVSIELQPVDLRGVAPSVNLLTNSDFETSADGWLYANSAVTLSLSKIYFVTGSTSLGIDNRTNATDGARQDVAASLINGMTYDTSVWVRSALVADNAQIQLYTRSTISGEQIFTTSTQTIDLLFWRKVSGTLTPRWEGELLEARWQVVTTTNVGEFYIDDAYFAVSNTSSRPLRLVEASFKPVLP